jgi:hypothetical protein
LQGLACGLLALSAADLFMTFALLRTSPAFFESNPVAQWFFALNCHGKPNAIFKQLSICAIATDERDPILLMMSCW